MYLEYLIRNLRQICKTQVDCLFCPLDEERNSNTIPLCKLPLMRWGDEDIELANNAIDSFICEQWKDKLNQSINKEDNE